MPMNPQQHMEHMAQVEAGLQQILQSNDLNQIKQIAQSLLGAEQQEASVENKPAPSFVEKYASVRGGENAE